MLTLLHQPICLAGWPLRAGHVQAEALTADVKQLLANLPLMQTTESEAVRLGYLKEVVKELTRIYYVRLKLTDDEAAKKDLVEQLHATIGQVHALLKLPTA